MSLIGVINSDPEVRTRIEKAFTRSDKEKAFMLHWAATLDDSFELLNFDLPEVVILNATDPGLDLPALVKKIHEDSWLHNFGIIAIYDKNKAKEAEVLTLLTALNLLSTIEIASVVSTLFNHVQIIEKNRQIIFQYEMGHTMSKRITGSFIIDNDVLSVPVYASLAATILVQRGLLAQENRQNLRISLSELILNGIEHGNCEISFEEKSAFLATGGSLHDLIAEKCQNPLVAKKRVHLEWDLRQEETHFYVRDEGKGFDVEAYQTRMKNRKADALHGRGIMMARSFGGKLSYNKTGNVAMLTIVHEKTTRSEPMGFSGEEVLLPQKGTVIFRQGEVSNHIYYISSGHYTVYHDDVAVGILTPADIFMGEMSFLLNNQRSATVVADTPGKIIKIARKSFVNSMRLYPQYGLFLSKLLARKLQRNNAIHVRKLKNDLAT